MNDKSHSIGDNSRNNLDYFYDWKECLVGLVTLGQINMPRSMPFTLIGLFEHQNVTFYKTSILEVKQELFLLLLLVLPY